MSEIIFKPKSCENQENRWERTQTKRCESFVGALFSVFLRSYFLDPCIIRRYSEIPDGMDMLRWQDKTLFFFGFVCCKDGLIKKGNENDLFWLNLWPDCRLFCFLFFFPLPVSLFNYVTIILFHWPLHFKPQWTDSRTNFSIAYYLLAISHQWLFSDVQ